MAAAGDARSLSPAWLADDGRGLTSLLRDAMIAKLADALMLMLLLLLTAVLLVTPASLPRLSAPAKFCHSALAQEPSREKNEEKD